MERSRSNPRPKRTKTAKNARTKTVEAFIVGAPSGVQPKLREVRAAIREAAPRAVEGFSYGMPFYDYKGRLAWFGFRKGYIGLYLRPPVIAEHSRELAGYETTKSAVHLPLDREMPVPLIKKLVRARLKMNEAGE